MELTKDRWGGGAAPAAAAAQPLIAQLLRHAANGQPLGDGEWANPMNAAERERQLQWALDGGLGPLLHGALGPAGVGRWPATARSALLSADLTARVRHDHLVASALEIIEVCDQLGVEAVLLKGISVSEQWYPQEHFRPMADIDVLIPLADYAAVEAALMARGHERLAFEPGAGLQHGAPLHHRARQSVIELHTGLFGEHSPLSAGTLFGSAMARSWSVPSRFHGQPVRRLAPELQLAYIASSWCNDLTERQVHPSFIASMFDAVYLLTASARTLDWNGLLDRLDNELAAASMHTLLTYLPRFGVERPDAQVMARLASRQRLIGRVQLALIHAALDRHLIAARPWDHLLPLPVPGRYSALHQIQKRLTRRRRQI
jgi:hypothetical protein